MLSDDYEEFTDAQRRILERYVTNTHSHIFALRNLPEVIKGALFSRYSRSNLGLRSLLLKEFIGNEDEAHFSEIAGQPQNYSTESQQEAIQKAQNFYDRILDGYGDDSIGELGGAHIAIENISMLAAKAIEDCRIGGSPLEKSTRYVYFDQKVNGEYLFYHEPILMTSAFRDAYISTCNHLFETYSALIPPLTQTFEKTFLKDPAISATAYKAALRAKVLDCLRGLLPASTLTNMGVFGNGRFYEGLLHKMHCYTLTEMQDIGRRMHEELTKEIPSFVRRSSPSHHTHTNYSSFYENMLNDLHQTAFLFADAADRSMTPGVRMLDYDKEGPLNVAAALLFPHCNKGLGELRKLCHEMSEEDIARILDAAATSRDNRRQKSPRALEHATFTFEIIGDYGSYRDLHRHRILTQEKQMLTCDYGFYIPPEIEGSALEDDYNEAMFRAKEAYDMIAVEFPEEAQYVVPMGYHLRWYFNVNLRALQWLCELRSSPAGHPTYRFIAQEMARQVCEICPAFERFFKFVDYEGYQMGRLGQEQRKIEKQHLLDA
ncbi:MAG: FAD-dependent thymidylate synthase [Parachlamydiales bacterium]|jgi:thymidylate synthase ThyX